MENNLIEKDLKILWHPYTQMKDCEKMPPIAIKRAEGVKLFDYDGNFYYDTISSWWCNIHGHNHPFIKEAIKKQLDLMEHVLFAGFTHRPAVELAEKLLEIAPDNLSRVFYSDNGSTAVEIALKMSFQYWQNVGEKNKKKFLSLDYGYHGDTIGTMSISGVDLFNKKFQPLFFDSFKAPTPYCYRCPCGKEKEECSLECLSEAEEILKKHSDEIAGFVLEPLLLGAGGMIIYPVEYLKGVSILAKKYNVHLILDEVATGFGRTGKMFACEHGEVNPDFLCLSKGITSGYMPFAATLTTDEIFDAFYGDYDQMKTFYHGHTYTANPLGCAAGIASLELFEKENTLENVKIINKKLKTFLQDVSEYEYVGETRCIGAVGAMELVKDKKTKEPFPPEDRVGLKIYKKGLESGLLLRPLGNVVYFFLPLCVTPNELDDIFQRAFRVLS